VPALRRYATANGSSSAVRFGPIPMGFLGGMRRLVIVGALCGLTCGARVQGAG
jgi:hypothetical protein